MGEAQSNALEAINAIIEARSLDKDRIIIVEDMPGV
jgi:hypothetical protein